MYFRSLHFGNVVLTPENTLGLIDIADLSCQATPLSQSKRRRNFSHLRRYAEDRQWLLGDDAGQAFFNGYRQALPAGSQQAPLIERLRQLLD